MNGRNTKAIGGPLLIIGTAALALRIATAILLPKFTNDWIVYSDVARNILGGCGVAMTTPGGACVPHFGGNQLPGYPAFIAFVWLIFGRSSTAVLIMQSLVASFAVARTAYAVGRASESNLALWACGTLLAVSPESLYWARSGLTEELAIAGSELVLAEMLLSFHSQRLRVFGIGFWLAAACYIRMDSIFLLAPVGVGALTIYGFRWAAFTKVAAIAAIVGTATGAWAIRNELVGVNIFPSQYVMTDGTSGPTGYLSWLRTWMTTEEQRASAMFFAPTNFDIIKIDPGAYASADERERVESLLNELRAYDGQHFPARIDAQFGELAAARVHEHPFEVDVIVPIARGLHLWETWVSPALYFFAPAAYPVGPRAAYRFALLLFLCLGAVSGFRNPVFRILAVMTVVFAVTKTLFLCVTGLLELRYLSEVEAFVEVWAGFAIADWCNARIRRRQDVSR